MSLPGSNGWLARSAILQPSLLPPSPAVARTAPNLTLRDSAPAASGLSALAKATTRPGADSAPEGPQRLAAAVAAALRAGSVPPRDGNRGRTVATRIRPAGVAAAGGTAAGPVNLPLRAPAGTIGRSRSGSRPSVAQPSASRPSGARPSDTTPAARFIQSLAARPPDPIVALPRRLEPLATAIAGPGRISLRTGAGTSAALASVGKQAATIGRVIHLAAPPGASARQTGVIAHELVHAARPSSVPRFFDDASHGQEERLARQVGHLARSLAGKPVPPAGPAGHNHLGFGTAGLAVGTARASAGSVAGRDGAAPTRSGTGPASGMPAGSPAASSLQRSLSSLAPPVLQHQSGSPGGAGADRGVGGPHHSGGSGSVGASGTGASGTGAGGTGAGGTLSPSGSGSLQRAPEDLPNTEFKPHPMAPTPATSPVTDTATPAPGRELPPETMEWIIDQIEQRVVDELERRGLRYHPGVY